MIFFFTPLIILLATAAGLFIYHWMRPKARGQWPLALLGSALSLGGVLLWHTRLPLTIKLGGTESFYPPIIFLVDRISWTLALALALLLWGSLFAAIQHPPFPAPRRWAGSMSLTVVGLLALTSNTPLTLAFIWVLLDFSELLILLPNLKDARQNEKAVILFSSRLAGVGLLIWAGVLSNIQNAPLSFRASQSHLALYILLAAGLRLGILPTHLPLESGSNQRRDLGVILRSIAALSSLILLIRFNLSDLTPFTRQLFLLFLLAAALQGSLSWLRAQNALSGRPFWIMGLSALAGMQSIQGNPAGVTALALTLTLGSGIISLYSVRKLRYSRLLALLGVLAMSGLPMSLSAPLWQAHLSTLWLAGFIFAYGLLLAGFAQHLLRASVLSLDHQMRLIRTAYLSGIFILAGAMLLMGFLPALKTPFSWRALISSLLALLWSGFLLWALRRWKPVIALALPPRPSRRGGLKIFALLWAAYRQSGRWLHFLVNEILENETGLLWVVVLTILLISNWISP